jgi:riboflavin transporter FmnP
MFPESVGLFFGLSALSLVFLQFGTSVPVSHHITLSATTVAALTGNLWWGLAFALVGAFAGELTACLFTAYADTHIDPPAAALAITATLTAVLSAAGVFALSGIIPVIVVILLAGLGVGLMRWLQKPPQTAVATATD